ncbi:MAG: YciI family protein [Bacteroidales bacterium]
MKKFIIPFLAMIVAFSCQPKQTEIKADETQVIIEPIIDSSVIKKLKADEYGMKQYVIAFLKRGPNPPKDSVEAANLQKAHLENIIRLADEGKLILAGPFMDNDDVRGIYIFDVTTIEEARKLTESDPAIQAGTIVMELKPWYGSAALLLVPEAHKKLEKKNIAE